MATFISPDIESTARAFEVWLRRERMDSHNSYLDTQLSRNWSPSGTNVNDPQWEPAESLAKASSHHSRYITIMRMIDNDRLRPKLMPKLMHHSLMFASGAFRIECFSGASAQQEYVRRRYDSGRACSVNIAEAVSVAIEATRGDGSWGLAGIKKFSDNQLKGNESIYAAQQLVHTTARPEQGFFADDSEVITSLREAQRMAIGLATGVLIMSASERNWEYAQTETYSPESITNAHLMQLYSLSA